MIAPTSSESNHRLLIEFLSREFARQKERMCVKVSLAQAAPGMQGRELRTWHREESPDLFENLGNVERLARDMLEMAESDASTLSSGRYRYRVLTTQHLSGTAQHAFQVVVSAEDEFAGIDEQPTASGAVAQQMRHTEWAIRSMMMMTQSVTGALQQQNRQLADDNHRMANDRVRIIGELERARAEEEERTMAMVLAERADDRKDKIINKVLLPLAPVALARFMSKGAPAGAAHGALPAILETLIDSFDPGQIGRMAELFTVEQRVLFMEAVKVVQETKAARAAQDAKERAESSRVPRDSPNQGSPGSQASP
jgi:hypothetical protein